MLSLMWLPYTVRRSSRRPRRQRSPLQVECLEDRTVLSTGLTPALLPASPLGMSVPGQFSQPQPARVSSAAVSQPATGTNPTNGSPAFPAQATGPAGAGQSATPTSSTSPAPPAPSTSAASAAPGTFANTGPTATPANGTVTGAQPAGTQAALAQQSAAQEARLAALAAGTPLSPAALAMLNAGVAPGPADLPFMNTGATGTVPLTLTAPTTTGLLVPQVAAEANGQLPASVGGFNRGLLTYEMEAMLSGGGGGEPALLPAPAQPNQGDGAAPARPAPVQMAPDDEIQEPQNPAPDAGPTVNGDAWPILLAPEQGPERLPGWDVLPAAAVKPEAVAQPPAMQPAVRLEAPVAAAEPRASLWGRLASVACFAAGALGAAWFPDVREMATRRRKVPVLRPRGRH
jgi:hypothetical protein